MEAVEDGGETRVKRPLSCYCCVRRVRVRGLLPSGYCRVLSVVFHVSRSHRGHQETFKQGHKFSPKVLHYAVLI